MQSRVETYQVERSCKASVGELGKRVVKKAIKTNDRNIGDPTCDENAATEPNALWRSTTEGLEWSMGAKSFTMASVTGSKVGFTA